MSETSANTTHGRRCEAIRNSRHSRMWIQQVTLSISYYFTASEVGGVAGVFAQSLTWVSTDWVIDRLGIDRLQFVDISRRDDKLKFVGQSPPQISIH
jgi:hypothetical protein